MTQFHILTGLLGIISGATALFAYKGANLHRRSGGIFVVAMLIMSSSGALMALQKAEVLSVLGGLLTFYLVTTAALAVRRKTYARFIDVGAMLMAFAVGTAYFYFGFRVASSAALAAGELPAPPYFFFGTVALLAAALDLRLLLAGGVHGAQRLARHLWRMCFALFIATASFFLGQPQVFPEAIRNPLILALPVVAVLIMMLYWLIPVLFSMRGYKSKAPGMAKELP